MTDMPRAEMKVEALQVMTDVSQAEMELEALQVALDEEIKTLNDVADRPRRTERSWWREMHRGQAIAATTPSSTSTSGTRKPVNSAPLSDDILCKIFQTFRPKDLRNLSLVCRSWRDAADSDDVWNQFLRSSFGVTHCYCSFQVLNDRGEKKADLNDDEDEITRAKDGMERSGHSCNDVPAAKDRFRLLHWADRRDCWMPTLQWVLTHSDSLDAATVTGIDLAWAEISRALQNRWSQEEQRTEIGKICEQVMSTAPPRHLRPRISTDRRFWIDWDEAFCFFHAIRTGQGSGSSITVGGLKHHVVFNDGKCLAAAREGGGQCVAALTTCVLIVAVGDSHNSRAWQEAEEEVKDRDENAAAGETDDKDVTKEEAGEDEEEEEDHGPLGRVGKLGHNVVVLDWLRKELVTAHAM